MKLTAEKAKKLFAGKTLENEKLFSQKKNDYYTAGLKLKWTESEKDKNTCFASFELVFKGTSKNSI